MSLVNPKEMTSGPCMLSGSLFSVDFGFLGGPSHVSEIEQKRSLSGIEVEVKTIVRSLLLFGAFKLIYSSPLAALS